MDHRSEKGHDEPTRMDMDITAFIKDLLTVDSKPLSLPSAALSVGDRLLGTVIELKKEGTVLMDFGRFRAISEVRFPVQVGEKLALTVMNTSERLELRLDSPPGTSQVRTPVPGPAPGDGRGTALLPVEPREVNNRFIADIVSQAERIKANDARAPSPLKLPPTQSRALDVLIRHLAPISMEASMDHIGGRIRTIVEQGGLFFEKRLEAALLQSPEPRRPQDGAEPSPSERPAVQAVLREDLKPKLLVLKAFFTENPEVERSHGEAAVRKIAADMERMLGDHDRQQNRIVEKKDTTEPFQMTVHTIPVKEQGNDIRLNIFHPRQKKGAVRKNPQISILLEMDRLGAVRSDLVLIGRDLNITFFVTSEATREAMAKGIEEIKRSLAPVFDHVGLQIQLSEEKVERLQSEETRPPSGRVLDLRA